MRVDACPESMSEYRAAGLVPYARSWLIWRGESGGLPASWCATRRVEGAGKSPTVIRDTARQLAEALAGQARAIRLEEEFARNPGGA